MKALRKAGATAEAHDDHFKQDTPDEVWIPDVSARGWLILTKDARIRRRKNELDAVKLARSKVFVVTTQGMKGSEVADLFVKYLKRIGNLARSRRPPFWATVTKSGVSLQKLERHPHDEE